MITSLKYLSKKFIKAQTASLTASLIDFSITYTLTSVGGQWYVLSSAAGVVSGGIVNFLLGRYWVFNAVNEKTIKQGFRYILVWFSSMFLNMDGTIFFTEIAGFYYIVSKLLTAILVGIFFNYYFQKAFVFKTISSIKQQ